jgi:hypothetical protein
MEIKDYEDTIKAISQQVTMATQRSKKSSTGATSGLAVGECEAVRRKCMRHH